MSNIYKPSYYDKFRCSAGECSDSCCIGWEIDIDDESLEKYRAHRGPLKERFDKDIVTENGISHFALGEKERCPFLNGDNLCDIYIEMGEDALCQICSDHPRYYDWYEDDYTEAGLGMACEEAAKLILNEDAEYPDGSDCNEEGLVELFSFRNNLIKEGLNFDPDFFTRENMAEMAENLLRIEINTKEWRKTLEDIVDNPSAVTIPDKASKEEAIYNRIYAYLIYRHFMKCRFDGDIDGRIAFAENGCHIIRMMEERLGLMRAAIIFSREIEYLE